MKKLGKFIKEMRTKKGLTRETLAEKLGCNKQQIFIWETDRAMIPIKHAPKLARALNLNEKKLVNTLVQISTRKMLMKMGKN